MRSSVVVALALAVAASPALAAPSGMPSHYMKARSDLTTHSFNGYSNVYKSGAEFALRAISPEYNDFTAPDSLLLSTLSRREQEELLARSWRGFWNGVVDVAKGTADAILPIAPDLIKAWRGKRELGPGELEFLSSLSKREQEELLARSWRGFWNGVVDVAKGAADALLPIAPDLIKAYRGKRGEFGNDDLEFFSSLSKREQEELLARSWRGFWNGVVDVAKGTADALLPIAPDLIKAWRGKRELGTEELEIFARAYGQLAVARSLHELD